MSPRQIPGQVRLNLFPSRIQELHERALELRREREEAKARYAEHALANPHYTLYERLRAWVRREELP